MSHRPRSRPTEPEAPTYQIRLRGHLGVRIADRFGAFDVRHEPDGTTTMTGTVVDQAALHGLLRRIRDLSLPLLAVTQIATAREEDGDGPMTPP